MAARKLPIILAVLLAVSVGLTAARVGLAPARAATGDSVVLAWNQQVLDTIVATKTGPTIAARALAVVHTAIYDAWAAYDPVAVADHRLTATAGASPRRAHPGQQEQGGQLRRLCRPGRPVPGPPGPSMPQMAAILGYAIDGSDTSHRGQVGAVAAQAVLDYRHHDGANQLGDEPGGTPGIAYSDYTGYKPSPKNTWDKVGDPDRWQPLCVLTDTGANGMPRTPPASCEAPDYEVQTYLTPFWAKVKPFALTSAWPVPPARPLHLPGGGRQAQRQVCG